MGAKLEYITPSSEDNFKSDFNSVLEKIKGKKMFILSNPNNPTDILLLKPKKIKEILNQYPETVIVVNEAYYEYSGVTIVDLIRDYPNLIVLRIFSKAFSLAGLRVRYSIASSEIVDYLMKVHEPFPVTNLAYHAISASLDSLDYIRDVVKRIISEREYREFQSLNNVKPYPSATNFLLFWSGIKSLAR